jgi:hypothetical protein
MGPALERLTTLAASVGCWHAGPVGVSAVLMLAPGCSPWRLQAAHGCPGSLTDGGGRPEIWRDIRFMGVARVWLPDRLADGAELTDLCVPGFLPDGSP